METGVRSAPPEPDDPLSPRRRDVAKRPPTAAEEEQFRQQRMRQKPVPEVFPLTGQDLSGDMIENLIDLCPSPGSEHRQDSCVPEAHVYTQDRDRARPLKRRVEVSLRNLTRDDRDAFTARERKEWASRLDKETGNW